MQIISLCVMLLGFTAMASQIILTREFLIAFYGNEFSVGIVLMNWLIGGAIGSMLLAKFLPRIKNKISAFALCQAILSSMLVFIILAIRSIKIFLKIPLGSIVPISTMVWVTFLILVPLCSIFGFMFALSCSIFCEKNQDKASGIGLIYILEAVGSAVAGILVSLFLMRITHALNLIGVLILVNVSLSFFLILFYQNKGWMKIVLLIWVGKMFLTSLASFYLVEGWEKLHNYSLSKHWQGYEVLDSKSSIYANITVVKKEEQTSFFNNGLLAYTVPDEQKAEEAVHFVLLEHLEPKSVLLIGGGVGGLVREALKEPVERVDYVELDYLIIDMAKKFLHALDYSPLEDKRVHLINQDGIFFVKNTNNKYDCIIMHLGDPSSLQLNRYYSQDFFREVKLILNEGGIFSFSLRSSENYLNQALRDSLGSSYKTLKSVFKDVKVIPGDTAYFLASDSDQLTYDYRIFLERINKRGIDLKYVRDYYLYSKLSAQRIAYLEDMLKKTDTLKINRDFQPTSYFYNMAFWVTYFKGSFLGKIIRYFDETKVSYLVIILLSFIILWLIVRFKIREFYREAVLGAVMAGGFSQMIFQVIILMCFQVIYGYLFYKIGIILASFMIGLSLGGIFAVRISSKDIRYPVIFSCLVLGISLYALILPFVFEAMKEQRAGFLYRSGAGVLFPVLSLIAGILCSIEFVFANKIYLKEGSDPAASAGILYGVDLMGSCIGALLSSVLFIPILGVFKTCFVVSAANFIIFIALFMLYKKGGWTK